MNSTEVTKEGQSGTRPGRDAPPGTGQPTGGVEAEARRPGGRRGRRYREWAQGRANSDLSTEGRARGHLNGRTEPPPPKDQPAGYYGLPVINKPVWEPREIAGYFFLGGLAGASSVLAGVAQLTGKPSLARVGKLGAAVAVPLSMYALIKDLGRPSRFLNMLRVFKVTSPMSVGTWALSAYGPAAMVAAGSEVTGLLPVVGLAGTAGAAALGPVIASYTGVLISDTAVPAWHEARSYMPFLFVSSAAMAAAGLGLAGARERDCGPAQRLAVLATAAELGLEEVMVKAVPPEVAKAYEEGKGHLLLQSSKVLAAAGALGALVGRRWGWLRRPSGLALVAASACTRFGVFYAGTASAEDPQATIGPQKKRLAQALQAT